MAEDASDRIVRLPFYTSMSEEEQGRVVEEIKMLNPCQWALAGNQAAGRLRGRLKKQPEG